jgi:hypothetical protein
LRQQRTPTQLFPGVIDGELFGVEELPSQSVGFAKAFVKIEIAVLIVHDDGVSELGEV